MSAAVRRPFLVLGILVLVWLFAPPVVSRLFQRAAFETLAPSLKISSYARDLQEFWTLRTRSRNDLIAAGRELAKYNAAMELRLNENELLRAEVSRLESLLRLPSPGGFRYEVARVERRDVSAWWQQCIIRKGANYGIQAGSPVVFAGGVVGRVREVGAYSSIVDLIGSPALRIAAVVEGDTRPVEYQGGIALPFQPALGRVNFVPLDTTDMEGDRPRRLLTSGLGGSFPGGLVLGTLESLRTAPEGLYKTGAVRLDPRLEQLREVAVLVAEDSPRGR
jgi:rod shape-determining protein MreC